MAPFLALGISLLPTLARLLIGEQAGQVAATVTQVVREVTGTDDADAARAKLDADPAAASALRVRLAEIALEGERLRTESEDRRHAEAMEQFRARLADLQGARGSMVALAGAGSALSWGPAMVSAIVTTGFFAMLALFLFWTPSAEHQQAYALLNIAVGALVAGFTAVINFWIGSSQGSRDKDETVRRLAAAGQQAAVSLAGEATLGRTQAVLGETLGRTQAALGETLGHTRAALDEALGRSQAAMAETLGRVEQRVSEGFRHGAAVAALADGAAAGDGPMPVAFRAGRSAQAEARFARCVAIVLGHEGGYANDPQDPGGPTMMGITQRMLAAWRGAPVTAEEVRDLGPEEAREIYRAEYWNRLRCDDLPPGLDLMVFDFGVNAGPGTAARHLQRALSVRQDGAIGPMTLAAAHAAEPRACIDRLVRLREAHYRALPGFERFGRGWLRRTDAVRRAAEAMAAPVMPMPGVPTPGVPMTAMAAPAAAAPAVVSASA